LFVSSDEVFAIDHIYGAKIDKKNGKANFKALKLINECIFLFSQQKLMPKWHELSDISTFWHMLCYSLIGLLSKIKMIINK
jgi:hypothetical protein